MPRIAVNSEIFHLPFSPFLAEPPGPPPSSALPAAYGREKLVALARDPDWIHLYWELSPAKLELITASLPPHRLRAEIHLSFAESGKPAAEMPCELSARKALVRGLPGRSYFAELGLSHPQHPFTVLLKSETVTLPFGSPEAGRERVALELPSSLRRFTPP